MTPTPSSRTLALLGGASAIGLLLAGQPAEAHGIAHGGLSHGFLHPLMGTDHLLLLLGVGTAAAALTPQLLLWGLAGAVGGALVGTVGGSLPGQELIASLAISALGLLVVMVLRGRQAPNMGFCGGLVAAAVAVHAMLHGLEAPVAGGAALWWSGALAASVLVSGGSYALLRRLPLAWNRAAALALTVLGGALTLGWLGGAAA